MPLLVNGRQLPLDSRRPWTAALSGDIGRCPVGTSFARLTGQCENGLLRVLCLHLAPRSLAGEATYSFSAAAGTCHLLFSLAPESLPLAKRRTTMLTGTCSRSATWRVVRDSTVTSRGHAAARRPGGW